MIQISRGSNTLTLPYCGAYTEHNEYPDGANVFIRVIKIVGTGEYTSSSFGIIDKCKGTITFDFNNENKKIRGYCNCYFYYKDTDKVFTTLANIE